MININISNHTKNSFSFKIDLDREFFNFFFNYNGYGKFWSINIYDYQNSLIFSTKVVNLFDFFYFHKYLSLPQGAVIFDTIYPDQNQNPDEEDFINQKVSMKYLTISEIKSLRS